MEHRDRLWPGGYTFLYDDGLFRPSTDTFLLGAFPRLRRGMTVCELGAGTGLLSLLLLAREPELTVTGVELQPQAAALAEENAAQDGLDGRFSVIRGDLREHRTLLAHGSFDAVVSNPPYYPVGSGKCAASPALAAARTELTCSLGELCTCAAWLLRSGGRFFLVHKPERLADLMVSLRENRLEPKRLRLVRHRAGGPVSLVLLEARLDGRPGLVFEPDLALFDENGAESEDHKRIYHHQEG